MNTKAFRIREVTNISAQDWKARALPKGVPFQTFQNQYASQTQHNALGPQAARARSLGQGPGTSPLHLDRVAAIYTPKSTSLLSTEVTVVFVSQIRSPTTTPSPKGSTVKALSPTLSLKTGFFFFKILFIYI